MKDDKIGKILEVLQKYMNSSDQKIPDYYQLFHLNSEDSIPEIQKSVKEQKLQALFHQDQLFHIPEFMRAPYQEMCGNIFINMINDFSSEENKERYDKKLQQEKLRIGEEKRRSQEKEAQEIKRREEALKKQSMSKMQKAKQEWRTPIQKIEVLEDVLVEIIQKQGFVTARKFLTDLIFETESKEKVLSGLSKKAYQVVSPLKKGKILEIMQNKSQSHHSDHFILEYLSNITYKNPYIIKECAPLFLASKKLIETKEENLEQCSKVIYQYMETKEMNGFVGKNTKKCLEDMNYAKEETRFILYSFVNLMNPSTDLNLDTDNDLYLVSNFVNTLSDEITLSRRTKEEVAEKIGKRSHH